MVSFWRHVFPEFPQTQFFNCVIEVGHDVKAFSGFNFYHNHSLVEKLEITFPLNLFLILLIIKLDTMSFILFYHTHIASIISLIQSQLLHFTAFTLQFLLSMTFFPLSFAWLCPSHSDLSSNINSSRALSMSSCLILLAFPNTIPSPCYQLYVTYLKYSYLLTCTIMVCFFP